MSEIDIIGSDCVLIMQHRQGSGILLAMSETDPNNKVENDDFEADAASDGTAPSQAERPKEIGGRGGLDPTRYGDWEKAGRCIDF